MFNKKWLVIVGVVLPVMMLAGCTEDGYIADKITVRDMDLGGMAHDEAVTALSSLTLDANETVTINADGEVFALSAGEIGAFYDAEKTADYLVEKSGGMFSGWFAKTYDPVVSVDEAMLDAAIKNHLGEVECEVSQTKVEIVPEGMQVTNGKSGKKLEREALLEKVCEQLGNVEKEEIEASFEVTAPNAADYDALLDEYFDTFKEATYILEQDGTITVTEDCPGVVFDKTEVKNTMKQHTAEGEVYTIPCEVKLSKYTKAYLEECLFRDTLASYKTNFSSSSANRAANINLATSAINNLVLMPGDEFSFNNTVGERTVERGYKTAGAYAAGQTVQQVGGGICQVSSTLYNTVLLSNLQITERRSHQMTVSYVPMGRDATVNWGTQDFKFKNNTDFPIKIVGTINGRDVTISMVGTCTIPNMEVKIQTSTVSVLSPVDKYEEDPTLPVGESKTKKGSTGYVVDAVRIVYSNGTEVSRESLIRSRYNPTNNIITVGTMPVEGPVAGQENPYELPPGLGGPIPGTGSETGL